MSPLLDAHKKSHPAQSGNTSHSESGPHENTRSTGLNLSSVKPLPVIYTGINNNLLLALSGTVLLLAVGAIYLWYIGSTSNTRPLHSINMPAPTLLEKPAIAIPQNTDVITDSVISRLANPAAGHSVLEITAADSAGHAQKTQLARDATPVGDLPSPHPRKDNRIYIQPQQTEPPDPLLNNAYLAYRNGKLDEAQQMYLKMLGKDTRNVDALLGLAVIAEQRGEDKFAAQYYIQVLALDPRNAVANAGISTLTSDDNSESRLKILLNRQDDSASLHFALGNLYADQSRWGEAQQAYFNAYTLNPENVELAFNLAVSLDRLGQNKSAAQYYQRALQLDQSHRANFDHAQIEQRVQELVR